ncbi:hypothetical protein ACNJN1_04850 [Citrobacter freundii]
MADNFIQWVLSVITSAGALAALVYFMRNTLIRFFTKTVEYRFDKRFEKFKAEIRADERELEQIRTFIVSARRERDGGLQTKRLEAAEIMMRMRQFLSVFTVLVEYVKVIDQDELLKKGDDPKVIDFINMLINPINIEAELKKYKEFDSILPKLYLSERSNKMFDIYESIVLDAVTMMKIYSIPLGDKDKIVKKGSISQRIIEVIPTSKESFEKFGEDYVYYWSDHFYKEILEELRNELSGSDNMLKDTEAATRLVMDSRAAQIKLRVSLEKNGLSDKIIKQEVTEV